MSTAPAKQEASTKKAPKATKAPAKATKPAVQPIMPSVDVWLSTADRRLKLSPQDAVAMKARDGTTADITIDAEVAYQSMTGFGAAMTDASAWLLRHRLNPRQRHALMRELYGPPPGLDFNMMRLTIGASDFSRHFYTLDDIPFGETDPDLKHFNVAENLLAPRDGAGRSGPRAHSRCECR